jgi:hypothetical protein
MFGSGILEVSIGLILVFLLFSLIMTAVKETVDAALKTRAKNLERALVELLGAARNAKPGAGQADPLAVFYSHPLVFGLYQGSFRRSAGESFILRGSGPSYIPSRTFAQAIIDLAQSGQQLPAESPAARAYQLFASRAEANADSIRAELEAWYDGAMDRASGWYRRNTQWLLLVGGFALAALLNINAFIIARHLSIDPVLRERIVAIAENARTDASLPGVVAPGPASGGATPAAPDANRTEPLTPEQVRERINALSSQVREAGLPIGWGTVGAKAVADRVSSGAFGLGFIELLLGYLAVGLAASLGAPFWFDVLNKFMVIRSTVKPREKSQEEGSEDRHRPAAEPPTAPSAAAGAPAMASLAALGLVPHLDGPVPDRVDASTDPRPYVYG